MINPNDDNRQEPQASKQATMDKNGSNVVLTEEVVTDFPSDENDGKHKVDML